MDNGSRLGAPGAIIIACPLFGDSWRRKSRMLRLITKAIDDSNLNYCIKYYVIS